ncbi:MAG: hypothetical protein Q7S37_01720 [bacterium]|nr:hypothetical protein [bacterium]
MVSKKTTGNKAVKKPESLVDLKKVLDNAEKQIRIAKQLLFKELYCEKAKSLESSDASVEGVFDGVDMVGSDRKTYKVPSNYASKSKLVAGDIMKLSIDDKGAYTYKQIGPVQRQRLVGVLCENETGYYAECEGRVFNVLAASVTYLKAKDGDRVTLLVARDQECNWAAIDNVISS